MLKMAADIFETELETGAASEVEYLVRRRLTWNFWKKPRSQSRWSAFAVGPCGGGDGGDGGGGQSCPPPSRKR